MPNNYWCLDIPREPGRAVRRSHYCEGTIRHRGQVVKCSNRRKGFGGSNMDRHRPTAHVLSETRGTIRKPSRSWYKPIQTHLRKYLVLIQTNTNAIVLITSTNTNLRALPLESGARLLHQAAAAGHQRQGPGRAYTINIAVLYYNILSILCYNILYYYLTMFYYAPSASQASTAPRASASPATSCAATDSSSVSSYYIMIYMYIYIYT